MTALFAGSTILVLGFAAILVLGLVALLVLFAGISRADQHDRRLTAQPDTSAERFARRTVGLYRRGGPPSSLRAA